MTSGQQVRKKCNRSVSSNQALIDTYTHIYPHTLCATVPKSSTFVQKHAPISKTVTLYLFGFAPGGTLSLSLD